jgi:hypothetical protein
MPSIVYKCLSKISWAKLNVTVSNKDVVYVYLSNYLAEYIIFNISM